MYFVPTWVRALVSNKLIKIYSDNSMIATHTRSKGKGEFNTILSHYDKYKRQCPGFPEYDNKYSSKMESIGKHASSILSLIKKEYKGDWHKPVRGIIKLCEIYDKELVDKACYRVLDDNYPDLLTTTILTCFSIYIISFFCPPFLFNCITYNI